MPVRNETHRVKGKQWQDKPSGLLRSFGPITDLRIRCVNTTQRCSRKILTSAIAVSSQHKAAAAMWKDCAILAMLYTSSCVLKTLLAVSTCAEKMAFMVAIYCAGTSGEPFMHKIRGLEPSVLDDADVPCCLWMRHSALDRAADQQGGES